VIFFILTKRERKQVAVIPALSVDVIFFFQFELLRRRTNSEHRTSSSSLIQELKSPRK